MLKKRIAGLVLVKNGQVVQSIGFRRYLPVGSVEVTVEFLSKWGVDEIVVFDIDASRYGKSPDIAMVERISSHVFVPVTIGGGIRSLSDIRQLVHAGADKVSINTSALQRPEFIREAADVFGAQCIIVAMDVRSVSSGGYEVCCDSGRRSTDRDPFTWAREAEELGAGEILINSIDRDGMKTGFELELLRRVVDEVTVPVIVCGGVGEIAHFQEGINEGASAVAAGNYFHFTEHSPIIAKAVLAAKGLDIRLETQANYADFHLEVVTGRLAKRDETYLRSLRFEIQKDEVI